MRSSTSSSDSPAVAGVSTAPRTRLLDRRVWIGLGVVFLALEVFTRTWLFSASKDFRRFRSYPDRAQALIATPGVQRVALIGNSATDRGVDTRVLEAELGVAGTPSRADLFVADQSRIDTWRFVFERYFAAPGLRPDLVVVTFYENDLEDGNPVEIGRLAQFFTSVRDWPEVMSVNLHSLDDRAVFAISSVWATFAASDRIRERLLAALVPDFREHSERVNGVIFEHERRRNSIAAARGAPSFVALQHLLDRAAATGVRLCFVAYPTLLAAQGAPYEISPGLPELLRGASAGFIDMRRVPVLRPEHYADDVHLTEEGRQLYSHFFGAALAGAIQSGSAGVPRAPSATK